MVKIQPFEVEQWMDKYETTPGVLNIAETCAASISIDDLQSLCDDAKAPSPLSLSTKLAYGAIRGSGKLRENVANLYQGASLSPTNILITQGAIAANYLLFYTLIGPGDHVICVYPTYQQLYSVPESFGAEVSLWKLKQERNYIPDVSELQGLVKPNTKLIILNNPNNPTGATIPLPVLESISTLAKSRNITILSDEVYSPLFHSQPESQPAPPSILALGYENTIATGSMSKAFSLAGIRLGWIATRNSAILEAVASARDYTTISVSQLDDQVATYALSPAVLPNLLKRNLELARTNLALLSAFVDKYKGVCEWVRPTAGTTALIKFEKSGVAVEGDSFAVSVLEENNVMFVPAKRCFGKGEDFEGFVRIGYVCETEVLKEGLERLGLYVEKHLL